MTALRHGQPFDYLGQLPGPGVTLLEASAGTGKTYTIASLVVRYIAAGVPVDNLLVVTFTKVATGELRNRVRDKLSQTYHGVRALRAGEVLGAVDVRLVELLACGTTAEVDERLWRMRVALANFDAATIATTHGFCEAALGELGLAGDSQLAPEFRPEVDDVIAQAATDVYVAQFGDRDEVVLAGDTALKLVREAQVNWYAPVMPRLAQAVGADVDRVAYVELVRREIVERKRRAGIMTYDDQVGRLRDAVTDPQRGPDAVALLRARYQVVLVDEFQDTDEAQWTALQTAFGSDTCLILIGDPKQSIYSFRGADIYAYLAARRKATTVGTLGSNFRSSRNVIAALDTLFADTSFGHDEIAYEPPIAGGRTPNSPRCALRLRAVTASTSVTRGDGRCVEIGQARLVVPDDVAADIVRRLTPPISPVADDAVKPGDIAVLVNTHDQAARVARALEVRQVPAVIRGNLSIFATPAAQSVLRLLAVIDAPSSDREVRTLAATDLIGMSAAQLASLDMSPTAPLNVLRTLAHDWSHMYSQVGLEPIFDAVRDTFSVDQRLLARADGEREFTDLLQTIEVVGAHARLHRPSAQALMSWLRLRMSEAEFADADERKRRLGTDADAVQVVTVHAAKGLEYPIVYCPYLWEAARWRASAEPFVYQSDGKRVVYVGGDRRQEQWRIAQAAQNEEIDAEARRKAYVALTRAKQELVIHWCRSWGWDRAPLTALLAPFDPDPDRAILALAAQSDHIAAEQIIGWPEHQLWTPKSDGDRDGDGIAIFDREIDQNWRRASFSSMTATVHDAHYGPGRLEPLQSGHQEDETDSEVTEPSDVADQQLIARVSEMSAIRGGADFGSFVHLLYEQVDFAVDDLTAELTHLVHENRRWINLPSDQIAGLVRGLVSSIETPLGSDLANVALRHVGRRDRLDEMTFEVPLAGGDTPWGNVSPAAMGRVLAATLATDDPLRGYLPQLQDPRLDAEVHGYLTGAIDLVLRTRGATGEKYSVVDYKTNRLAADELTAWSYRPDAVTRAVFDAHYPVQFLIYVVALHRYLKQRLPGYDPDVQLGPVKYLFVRGMFGSDNPEVAGQPCGVFSWQPTPAVVLGLSDLFARGEQ